MFEENNKADYTIEEWLSMFKESEIPSSSGDGRRISAFELASTQIVGMSNYADYPDNYWGFVFLETIRFLSSKISNELLSEHKFKIVNLDEFLPEKFEMMYLIMVNMEILNSRIDWGTSIRGAWLDYINCNCPPTKFKLYHCGLELKEEQVFPEFTTHEEIKIFFTALIIYYDNYLVEIGEEKYNQIKEMVYSGKYNEIENLDMFYP